MYVIKLTHKNYKQTQKSGYSGEGGKGSKHGVRQVQPRTLFKKIHFKGLWQKLNVCSM